MAEIKKTLQDFINEIGDNNWGGNSTNLYYGLSGMSAEGFHIGETSDALI